MFRFCENRRGQGITKSSKVNGLSLALRSLPRVFSQKFLQQLKTILFGRAGVESASEQPNLKRRYINVCNE